MDMSWRFGRPDVADSCRSSKTYTISPSSVTSGLPCPQQHNQCQEWLEKGTTACAPSISTSNFPRMVSLSLENGEIHGLILSKFQTESVRRCLFLRIWACEALRPKHVGSPCGSVFRMAMLIQGVDICRAYVI